MKVLVTVAVLSVALLFGLRAGADGGFATDSPISPLDTPTPPPEPLPTPTPTLGPPEVCEMTVERSGPPTRTENCRVDVIQDEGRMVVVELITAYKVPDHIPAVVVEEGAIEWGFSVSFASVPCWLKPPYARFYLKAVDMYYEGKPGYVCDEVFLYMDNCLALPLVGKGLNK